MPLWIHSIRASGQVFALVTLSIYKMINLAIPTNLSPFSLFYVFINFSHGTCSQQLNSSTSSDRNNSFMRAALINEVPF